MGSTFSIEQMMTTLSPRSRITSSSYSFQPMSEVSTSTCAAEHAQQRSLHHDHAHAHPCLLITAQPARPSPPLCWQHDGIWSMTQGILLGVKLFKPPACLPARCQCPSHAWPLMLLSTYNARDSAKAGMRRARPGMRPAAGLPQLMHVHERMERKNSRACARAHFNVSEQLQAWGDGCAAAAN